MTKKKLFFISPENKIPLKKVNDFKKIKLINIDYKNKTLEELTMETYSKIIDETVNEKNNFYNFYLGGFSIGALVALFITATIETSKPKELILYSPSPYLSETETILNPLQKHITEKNKKIMESAKEFSIKKIIKNIQDIPVNIYVGSKEFEFMIEYAKELHKMVKKSSLTVADGYSHSDICDY